MENKGDTRRKREYKEENKVNIQGEKKNIRSTRKQLNFLWRSIRNLSPPPLAVKKKLQFCVKIVEKMVIRFLIIFY